MEFTAVPAVRFGQQSVAFRRIFGFLQVTMGLVLLLACSNVAGLLAPSTILSAKGLSLEEDRAASPLPAAQKNKRFCALRRKR